MKWLASHQQIIRDLCIIVAIAFSAFAIAQINSDRISNCQAANARHTASIAALQSFNNQSEQNATPAQRARAKTAIQDTTVLVNALAPYRKC